MRVTTAPEALPGACFKCNSDQRDFFFDMEMSIEFHGAIFICNECFFEMLSISPEIVGFKGEISELEDKLNEANFKVTNYEEALDGLFSNIAWANLVDVRSSNGELSQEGNSDLRARPEKREKKGGRSAEQVNDKDLGGVPADDAFKLDL